MKDSTKITQTETRTFLKEKLATDKWAKHALLKIYEFQTADEQEVGYTREYNGVGFTGVDGDILSSFAEFLKSRKFLSPKQMTILKKKMPKYWKQVLKISDTSKLNPMIIANRA